MAHIAEIRAKMPDGVQVKAVKKNSEIAKAMRSGNIVETAKKFNAGGNKQHQAAMNSLKLAEETEELHHDRISLDLGKLIQRVRMDLGMSQKDLAVKINEKHTVITEYESGKAIPNQQIFSKLERVLNVKLRGKDIGKPFPIKKVPQKK
uniref:Endothelial differentiation-related factor 1 (inferred by orthology to a human protein) n=1 Tax=Strongyloides venezuelensis TaxID=75913 RepID=A0A0K0FYM6_STRVS